MNNYETIQRALGRIEGQLDGIVTRLTSGAYRMEKLEERVTNNEGRVWRMIGATGVLSALSVFALGLVPWATLVK